MSIAKESAMRSVLYAVLGALVSLPLVFPGRIEAQQTAGNKAVYGPSGVTFSTAYIDASAVTQSSDVCLTLSSILSGTAFNNTNGAVIDARGIGAGTTQPCTVNPWGTIPSGGWNTPATILLPSGTITVSKTWIIPNFSRIVGEGPGVTTLAAASTFAAGVDGVNAMVEMGSLYSASCAGTYCFCGGPSSAKPADCVGVQVKDLSLDGSNYAGASTLIGIENQASQELSIVDHVTFNDAPTSAQTHGMLGLDVFANISGNSNFPCSISSASCSSNNSGPYSNLIFTAGTNAGAGTQCAAVTGEAGVRGIHGFTCTSSKSTPPSAGITLDASSTSLEDIFVNGFGDGIQVGSKGLATQADVLLNVTGGATLTNLIHIESIDSAAAGSSNCPPSTGSTEDVCDLSVLHATSSAGNTILDDITHSTLANSGDATVGMYILGEELGTAASGQYSRFSTSPTYPSWSVGNSSPGGNSCTSGGSLYSNTTATSTTGTLFACVGTTWQIVK